MDTVPTDTQFWWDTQVTLLQLSGKGYNLRADETEEGKKIPENISKISTGRKHKSQKSSAFKLLSRLGYGARTPPCAVAGQQGEKLVIPPPTASIMRQQRLEARRSEQLQP